MELGYVKKGSLAVPQFALLPIKKLYIGRPIQNYRMNDTDLFKSGSYSVTIGKYSYFYSDSGPYDKLIIEDGDEPYTIPEGCKFVNVVDTIYMGRTIKYETTKLVGPFSSLKKATICSLVTDIPDQLFRGCVSLTDLTMEEGLTKIGSCAFLNCKTLERLTIPNSVTVVGSCAFYGCESLKYITLGNKVQEIGAAAFWLGSEDTAPLEIRALSQIPPQLGSELASKIYETTTLYVPDGCAEAYRNADVWCNFATIKEIITLVESISSDNEDINIKIGESQKLEASYSPDNASHKTCTWQSSDESIATVAADGLVTAVGVGLATITATATDSRDVFDMCEVHVNPILAESITITGDTHDLKVGESAILKATILPDNTKNSNIAWVSSNQNVATVNQGVVQALSIGSATIIATTTDGSGLIDNYIINVIPTLVESIAIKEGKHELEIGDELSLIVSVLPEDAADKSVVWDSSNSDVAIVKDGIVSALSAGGYHNLCICN